MNQLTWIGLAAVVIGGLVRALKSNGMTRVLANLKLPPIPKRALPWVALALGAGSAVLDAKMQGASWKDAGMGALASVALAVLGHDLGKGLPGVKKIVGLALIVTFASAPLACTPTTKALGRLILTAIEGGCVMAREDIQDEKVLREVCRISEEKGDALHELVAMRREAAAMRAGMARDAGADR